MCRFICPHCHAVALLDVSRPPVMLREDDREATLRLEPFFVPCGRCGQPVAPPCSAAYIGNGFTVRLVAPGFRVPKAPDGCVVLRETDNLLSFREKILVLDAGYDDRAVEILKLITEAANGGGAHSLLVMDATKEELVFSAQDSEGAELLFRSPRALHDRVRSQLEDMEPDTGFQRVDRAWAAARIGTGPVHVK